MSEQPHVIDRMYDLIQHWDQRSDDRAIFLTCYWMMTRNMQAAVEEEEFHDPVWVNNLLVYFATYYFDALDAFDAGLAAPAVWQLAFEAAAHPHTHPLQNLMLGVNAHINYDLVLVVADLLQAEWPALSPEQRQERYADYCKVNEIIARTIDAVQDEVLERRAPRMNLVDRGLGRLDEQLVVNLITRWRDQVWQHAMDCMSTASTPERERLRLEVEAAALKRGRLMLLEWKLI